ncbi:sirohydrochlorin chelatase [Denitrobaculum tricleocarpae]|uniref:Cobalamin biosynthesis protein CbiX n=1 Tax=Denitrobaculum tricleocarpae TaxID=2591009 RepID=A0A545TMR3_9PROT|nr:CbiX/SirB N-terminal domain-containing protein [Denitrobaculum tricleocarpae]TQV78520.1 cobalamin biosynthesis protein CbiX [Denitrobaculum tricleocarpae]
MFGTRSPFPTAHHTERPAVLIVAHGSPSAPEVPEAAIKALAKETARWLPGWNLDGATLAAESALETALNRMSRRHLLIYPFFMSDGWFVRTELPRRLRAGGQRSFEVLTPFGHNCGIPALCEAAIKTAAKSAGDLAADTNVLLAAHGSRSVPQQRRLIERTAGILAASNSFRGVHVGFLEELPSVGEAARLAGAGVCLPLFVGRAGHVEIDLPRALAAASWSGTLLDPLGTWPEIPDLIATSLLQSRPVALSG